MRKINTSLFILLFIAVFFFSCKPQVPSKYLQPDEMEDILFDYHIAMGMISENDSDDSEKHLYTQSVFKKYGITEAEFDSSLVYYTRHSDRFLAIYEDLSKRLDDEAVSLGASAGNISKFGENALSGDTSNIWKTSPSIVLATVVPNNVESFHFIADSTFHKGDKIVFSFDTQFIFQDGYKDGVAMLAVRFSNDSIASRFVHISSSGHYDIIVADDDRVGIKSVRGFISLQNQEHSSFTTLKLMFVSNISLVKCHVNENLGKDAGKTSDSKKGVVPVDSNIVSDEKRMKSLN